MAGPLLETKFHVPKRRRGLVARPRLTERLSRGAESALMLVSAPPGFGKTTLLTEWLAAEPADGRAAAWLSLDERDNDPALFWAYFVAALETVVPGVGATARSMLVSSQSPMEAVLATLLNDLNAVPNDVVLVLDDYHVIEAHEVQDAVGFVLEHLPPQLHLVIASRADPALALARLRARGELVEIRAADLRFTPDEAAVYLNEVMGLDLMAQDVAALETRTEGWIAALQLAALSLQGRHDIAGFVASFAGDDRYIVDYLTGEVLQRQPQAVRSFLLETSVLNRLTGSLCDVVTGQDDGKDMLEALDRRNLFLIPLDDRRQWYRYHHLFADVLRARLLDERPDHVHDLHRRASTWYEQDGDPAEAIGHALAGQDFERAADLIELATPLLRRARQEATLRRWLDALPDEVFPVRPVLSITFVGARMVSGELEGIEARLQDAERWLDAPRGASDEADAPPTAMVVTDPEEFRRLPSQIAIYRAAQARILGDVVGTIAHAHHALELATEDDDLGRGGGAGFLGLAYWTLGDLDAAHRWYADAMASLERAGHHSDALGCALALADIRISQGRLRDAMRTYERGLDVAANQGPPGVRGTAGIHVGMSVLLRERNDLEAARQHLLTSRELGEHAGLAQNAYRWRVAMARVQEAEGDRRGALELLDEAERRYTSEYFPDVWPIAARRARVWVSQGAVADALRWAREQGLSVDDELSYLREFEHITLARALVADGAPAATGFLERLLAAAEAGHRIGSVVEILALLALAHEARGDVAGALALLEQALTLSEPEGFVRVFLDEGPPMAALLRALVPRGVARDRARYLLASGRHAASRTPPRRGLVEPLSARELDVLRLLRSDLAGPEIAGQLMVSLSTVRTHTKNIYVKLGVNDRRAAVRRADELDL
jgi:LuxR family transcriptional regulator, maltose regulon positive regulatory protein